MSKPQGLFNHLKEKGKQLTQKTLQHFEDNSDDEDDDKKEETIFKSTKDLFGHIKEKSKQITQKTINKTQHITKQLTQTVLNEFDNHFYHNTTPRSYFFFLCF